MHRWPALALFPLTAALPFAARAQQPPSCDHLATLTLPRTKIISATVTAAGTFTPPGTPDPATSDFYAHLPAFCRVIAQATPSPDSNIHIEVWLPLTAWNGKFRGQGNGGFAGAIDYQLLALAISQHYASAATDTGHTGNPSNPSIDATWALHHSEKINDFGYRGIHFMTVTARSVIDAFYGKAPTHTYFASCSDGGREALMEAQRYPNDYDGILAGAPAYYWTNLVTSAAHKLQVLTRTPASFIPASKVPAISAAVLAQCDKTDGIADGILADPRQCHFKPETLLCKGPENPDCLTSPQITSLNALYAPTLNADGRQVYPGALPGGEDGPGGWATWILGDNPDKSLGYAFSTGYFSNMVYDDPHWDYKSFSLDNALKMAQIKTAQALNATDPNLRPFSSHGGKLILYHGWNDPAISPLSTIDYYHHVTDINDNAATFTRLFLVPGMQHCLGGPGPSSFGQFGYRPGTGPNDPQHNLSLALENWVEKGTAPNEVIAAKIEPKKDATGKTTPTITITRPLCAWPAVAKYKGTGDTNAASNFTCTTPKP